MIPPALREALEDGGICDCDACRHQESVRARAMAAALRWARLGIYVQGMDHGVISDAIAALEQE